MVERSPVEVIISMMISKASNTAYIAFVGGSSAKKEYFDICKQHEVESYEIDSKLANLGVWLHWDEKLHLCIYHIDDHPSKWVPQLQQRLDKNQLDIIILNIDAFDFEESSQIVMTNVDAKESKIIISHWIRIHRENTNMPDPIFEIYNKRQVYLDFLHQDFDFTDNKFLLGICHNVDEDVDAADFPKR